MQQASPHIGHLVTRGHHQGGFAGLVHAAEPAGVERRLAYLLFIDASILPDLHRAAAARANIAVARDDNGLVLTLIPQCAPTAPFHTTKKHERPHDASVRQIKRISKANLELGRHVAVGWQVAVDFETNADFNQNGCRPGHSVLPLGMGKEGRTLQRN